LIFWSLKFFNTKKNVKPGTTHWKRRNKTSWETTRNWRRRWTASETNKNEGLKS
jgi:hypothetical protein